MVDTAPKVTMSAHYGWRDWLAQRVTAVVITLYTLLIFGIVLWHGGMDYATWKAVVANGAFKLTTFVFMIAVFYHAWVGVRNVAMDYIKPTGVRLTVQIAVICALIAYAGWTVQVLWG